MFCGTADCDPKHFIFAHIQHCTLQLSSSNCVSFSRLQNDLFPAVRCNFQAIALEDPGYPLACCVKSPRIEMCQDENVSVCTFYKADGLSSPFHCPQFFLDTFFVVFLPSSYCCFFEIESFYSIHDLYVYSLTIIPFVAMHFSPSFRIYALALALFGPSIRATRVSQHDAILKPVSIQELGPARHLGRRAGSVGFSNLDLQKQGQLLYGRLEGTAF